MVRDTQATHYNSNKFGRRYEEFYLDLFEQSRAQALSELQKIIDKEGKWKKIVDIGGGTGATIEHLQQKSKHKHYFILVEPFQEMVDLALLRQNKPHEILIETADTYASRTQKSSLDIIICQEMIHHIKNIELFFSKIFTALRKNGSMMIITRPLEVDFPFGKHGLEAWKRSYSFTLDHLRRVLREVGFVLYEKVHSFPLKVEKRSWLEMVGERPVFSNLSSAFINDVQKQADLLEIAQMDGPFSFQDTQLFITCIKQSG